MYCLLLYVVASEEMGCVLYGKICFADIKTINTLQMKWWLFGVSEMVVAFLTHAELGWCGAE